MSTSRCVAVVACVLAIALFGIEFANVNISKHIAPWIGKLGRDSSAGYDTERASAQSGVHVAVSPSALPAQFTDSNANHNRASVVQAGAGAVGMDKGEPAVSSAVQPSFQTPAPSATPPATADPILESMLPITAGTPIVAHVAPLHVECPLAPSLREGYCDGQASLRVTGYFKCSKPDVQSLCIVNKAAPLQHSDVIVRYLPNPTRDVMVNGKPFIAAPSATIILRLLDAVVDGNNGAVFNGTYYLRLGRPMMQPPGANAAPKLVAPRVPKLASVIMVWCDSFQHFMFDCLPRVELVTRLLQDDPDIKILVQGGVGFRDIVPIFWEPLGISSERFVVARGDTVYPADAVYLPFYEGQLAMGLVPPNSALRWAMPRLWGKLAPGAQRNIVLYIGRAGRSRTVTNEAALLRAINASLVPPYTLRVLIDPRSWREHVDLFAQTHVMLGPHGGAFSSMAFIPPPAHVVEFLSTAIKDPVRHCYAGMAAGLGLTFWRYEPPKFGYNQPMTVVPTDVVSLLAEIGVART